MRRLHPALKGSIVLVVGFIFLIIGFIGALILSFGAGDAIRALVYPNVWIAFLVGSGLVIVLYLFTKIKGKVLGIGTGVFYLVLVAVLVGGSLRANYVESLRIQERGVDLFDYEPFQNRSLLARLDRDASFKFTEENRLRLDGATALYPVYAAFVEATYPEGVYRPHLYSGQNESLVVSTKTQNAYERLILGETDMIFVAGPSQRQLQDAQDWDVTFNLTPIGKEAFVFFVHEDNPVTSLTLAEVQWIYAGDITNWNEVGGENRSILAYQRPEGSGSQTALQNLMGNIPLIEPEREHVIGGMGGIVTETASYRNHKNALGYSFRFFSQEMVGTHTIKHLEIEGVYPTRETIRDGSYPISSAFYAVTIEERETQEMRDFIDWILSSEGQELVEKSGYVRIESNDQ